MHVKETAKVGPSSGFQIGRAKWASSRLQSKRAASQALATSKLMLMANRASSLAPMTSPPITATGKNELMASWTNRSSASQRPGPRRDDQNRGPSGAGDCGHDRAERW
jgi:hypothetical protein